MLSLSDKYHKKLIKFKVMTLTENNAITPKLSITEHKKQYVQTINNFELVKVLRKDFKLLEAKQYIPFMQPTQHNFGGCAVKRYGTKNK